MPLKNICLCFCTRLYISCFLCILMCGCSSTADRHIADTLQLSGDNRGELQKVLEHYRNDTLKLRAARFLIENMTGCYGYSERAVKENLDDVYNAYDSINRAFGYVINNEWGKSIDFLSERSSTAMPASGLVADLSSLNSKYLINEIDRTFDAWRRNVYSSECSFDSFLEYVLPYRRLNGLVVDGARDTFYNRHIGDFYAAKGKSWENETDSLLYKYHQLVYSQYFGIRIPLFKASTFERLRRGLCIHRCWYNSLLLSSLGMPVAIDIVPAWGNRNNSHAWNVLVMDGKPYAFETFWDDDRWKYNRIYNNLSSDSLWGKFRLPKVYRYTYSNHPEGPVLDKRVRREDIPELFRNIKKKDVSHEYFETCDVNVALKMPVPNGVRYAYLAVFGYQRWNPVQWGKIDKRGKVVFKGMGKGMVYLPVFYINGNVMPASSPFKLDGNGNMHILHDDGTRGKVFLRNIIGEPVHDRNIMYLHSLRGVRFVGLADGREEELCKLPKTLNAEMNKYSVDSPSSYRYVRMYLPSDTLAAGEISFYTSAWRISSVKVMNKVASLSEFDGINNLTDGIEATTCRCRAVERYIDFDLGKYHHLTGVGLYPYLKSWISENRNYCLFYWDDGWKSVETKNGTKCGWVDFDDVPLNCLLMLKDMGWRGASIERPFIYRGGEICWE